MSVCLRPRFESSSEQLENASMTQASHDRNQLDSIVQLVTCENDGLCIKMNNN